MGQRRKEGLINAFIKIILILDDFFQKFKKNNKINKRIILRKNHDLANY
jgi:hypothetical protein